MQYILHIPTPQTRMIQTAGRSLQKKATPCQNMPLWWSAVELKAGNPGCLVEIGFLTNLDDFAKLRSDVKQITIANDLYGGIKKYYED